MIHVRPAGPADARAIAELVQRLIETGAATALVGPITRATVRAWMATTPDISAWRLAEGADGDLLGVQWVAPHPALPAKACDIATFTAPGRHRIGVGSRLFDSTRAAAAALGYRWINATIRSDNAGALAYYQSRGFEPYARERDRQRAPGRDRDRISHRHDL